MPGSSAFFAPSRYSPATPSTVSSCASPRTRRLFAAAGVSPTSIVIATFGRADSACTFGDVVAVQTTMRSPFQ
jgi:hypothetical protein